VPDVRDRPRLDAAPRTLAGYARAERTTSPQAETNMTALRAWFGRCAKGLLSMSRLKGLAAIFAITPKA